MRVLHLAQARVLLWAHERGEPFEVSKVVAHPLQPRCSSAPRCPDESGPFSRRPAWVDPAEPPQGPCPYAFRDRGECLRHRNQVALESALFTPSEARLVRRLLEAMGYEVSEEAIDPVLDRTRILQAHGYIGPSHQVRLLSSPGTGSLVLVRELTNPAAKPTRPRQLRVLPVGGNR